GLPAGAADRRDVAGESRELCARRRNGHQDSACVVPWIRPGHSNRRLAALLGWAGVRRAPRGQDRSPCDRRRPGWNGDRRAARIAAAPREHRDAVALRVDRDLRARALHDPWTSRRLLRIHGGCFAGLRHLLPAAIALGGVGAAALSAPALTTPASAGAC